jgi:hypothetical protein
VGLVWTLGVALTVAGVGTWARSWYAPLSRVLNGIHPRWLGPAHVSVGAAILLYCWATVVTSAGMRATLLICAIDAVVSTIACLSVGFRLRGHASSTEPPRRRQYPTGGPLRERPDPCDH